MKIEEFPLADFDSLAPLLMRCFPAFWEVRLNRNMRSFPYDLRLFVLRVGELTAGCVGVHPYPFRMNGKTVHCGGLSDVAVDPDFRGRGYARELQKFALEFCEKIFPECPVMPLYTDKPGVYLRMGWELYEPDASHELCTADFPLKDPVMLNAEHRMRIRFIYEHGQDFNGKCVRSEKTWDELFADPVHSWMLEAETYFLYREGLLIEAYSCDRKHPVRDFIPGQGGHDSNRIMLNLSRRGSEITKTIAEAMRSRTLYFPAADIF